MKHALSFASGLIAASSAGVMAQSQSTGYSLLDGSEMKVKGCIPDLGWSGPLTGSFTLTQTSPPGTVSDTYAISGMKMYVDEPLTRHTIDGYGVLYVSTAAPIQQQIVLDVLVDGQMRHFDSGKVPVDTQLPPSAIRISALATWECGSKAAIGIFAKPDNSVCYANCDGSQTQPILNVNDFVCFLNAYATGEPYANCDGSMTVPVLNVADFDCFLQRFGNGCP